MTQWFGERLRQAFGSYILSIGDNDSHCQLENDIKKPQPVRVAVNRQLDGTPLRNVKRIKLNK